MRVKFRSYSGHVAVLLGLMCLYYGCNLAQQWSENYALLPGVTASDPAIIDGKPETVGQSQRKKGSGSVVTDLEFHRKRLFICRRRSQSIGL